MAEIEFEETETKSSFDWDRIFNLIEPILKKIAEKPQPQPKKEPVNISNLAYSNEPIPQLTTNAEKPQEDKDQKFKFLLNVLENIKAEKPETTINELIEMLNQQKEMIKSFL